MASQVVPMPMPMPNPRMNPTSLSGLRPPKAAGYTHRYVGLGSTSARRGRAPRGIQIGGATGTTWEPGLPRAYYPPGRGKRVALVAPVRQRVRRLAA
jgi:hypothetical protein